MEQGDLIIYQYTHWLNSRSKTVISKEGYFIRYVTKRNGKIDKCLVMLNGNKNPSKVWINEVHLNRIDK